MSSRSSRDRRAALTTLTYTSGNFLPGVIPTKLFSGSGTTIDNSGIVFSGSSPMPINWSGSSEPPETHTITTTSGGFIVSGTNSSSALGILYSASNVITLGTLFSSSASELQAASYMELSEALTELYSLDDDCNDWKIQPPVYNASLQVAAALMENDVPKPGVFIHGRRSVVFNWTIAGINLYLTISKSKLSVLLSSPEGIEMRTEFVGGSGEDTNRFFSALGSAHLISPPEPASSFSVPSDK
jgi:hypothetical protein